MKKTMRIAACALLCAPKPASMSTRWREPRASNCPRAPLLHLARRLDVTVRAPAGQLFSYSSPDCTFGKW